MNKIPPPHDGAPPLDSRASKRLATLDASIARGLADASAGRTNSAQAIFDRLEAKYRVAPND
jgi:predicted transcriptional regulator